MTKFYSHQTSTKPFIIFTFQISFSQGIVLNGNTIECDSAAVGDSAVIGGKTILCSR